MNKVYILLVGLLLCLPAAAKNREYKGRMSVEPKELIQQGDSLYVTIEFNIEGVNVDAHRSISLIPVLEAPGVEKKLPEVMVKGRVNYLTSKREVALMSKNERRLYERNPPYAIVEGYKSKSKKSFVYHKAIAFEPWMKDAKLNLVEDLCGCGNKPRSLSVSQLVGQVQLERIVEPYAVIPYLAYIQPEVEAVKKREMVSEAFLDFVVNKYDIRPDYMNNPRELKKITDIINEIHSDAALTVSSISVVGYASPEGGLKSNKLLSENRADALVNYLLPRFDYPYRMYHIEFGGENWAGLVDVVQKSDMMHKELVLSILNDRKISDEVRKTKLKQCAQGEPYRYMLKNFYPSLRKAIVKIDYLVKHFDVEEAKVVVRMRPQNLSLNEMYLVANTYEVGSDEFVDLFETAVRMFPEDQTANLNAAASALSRRDTVGAERYLNKVVPRAGSAQYNNTMGVLMMLKGQYDKAQQYLQAAIDGGLDVAKLNMDELNKKLENIEAIEKQSQKKSVR